MEQLVRAIVAVCRLAIKRKPATPDSVDGISAIQLR